MSIRRWPPGRSLSTATATPPPSATSSGAATCRRAIRRLGLPEGVLADGGEISGFLYFENATKRERRLTLRADIDGAQDGDRLTKIELPFQVQ